MADNWPRPNDAIPKYSPSNLFDEAAQIADGSISNQGTQGLLRSLLSMLRNEIVDGSDVRNSTLLNLAIKAWPYHPEISKEVLKELPTCPSPEEVAGLMEHIDIDEATEFSHLQSVWSHFAENFETSDSEAVIRGILNRSPKGNDADPDLCLTVWLDVADDKEILLQNILQDTGLNDTQKQRAWLQVRRIKDLSIDFFLNALPIVVDNPEAPQLTDCVLESLNEITKRFSGEQNYSKLAIAGFKAFFSCHTREGKRRIANWLKDLGGESHLRELAKQGTQLESEDAEILKQVFPAEKRVLAKITRKQKEEDA
jgi:hypothetical protein